jgi:hypothetical protein
MQMVSVRSLDPATSFLFLKQLNATVLAIEQHREIVIVVLELHGVHCLVVCHVYL